MQQKQQQEGAKHDNYGNGEQLKKEKNITFI
jgi:hypothetical protein